MSLCETAQPPLQQANCQPANLSASRFVSHVELSASQTVCKPNCLQAELSASRGRLLTHTHAERERCTADAHSMSPRQPNCRRPSCLPDESSAVELSAQPNCLQAELSAQPNCLPAELSAQPNCLPAELSAQPNCLPAEVSAQPNCLPAESSAAELLAQPNCRPGSMRQGVRNDELDRVLSSTLKGRRPASTAPAPPAAHDHTPTRHTPRRRFSCTCDAGHGRHSSTGTPCTQPGRRRRQGPSA